MRDASTQFTDTLAGARDGGIKARKFVWFALVDASTFGFWSGDEDITIQLTDGNGNTVNRTYFGNGELKTVSAITYVSDLSIQTTTVTMSKIAPHAQDLLYAHDPRLATVEIHDGLMSSASTLAADPELAMWGIVDGAPRDVPGVGQDSSVAIAVAPMGIRILTKTNPAKRSYESQKGRRGGDELYLYANSANTWQRYWGEAQSS